MASPERMYKIKYILVSTGGKTFTATFEHKNRTTALRAAKAEAIRQFILWAAERKE